MPAHIHKLTQKIDTLFDSTERNNTEALWDELYEFMLNNQSGLTFRNNTSTQTDLQGSGATTTPGAKRTRRIYDSTAIQACQELASAFQGTLTNPATIWSNLRYTKDEFNDNEEAVAWLNKVNKIIHNKYKESNLDTEIAKSYQSLVAIANSALFVEEEGGNLIFTALHMGQVAWTEDKRGLVNSIVRKFEYSAEQAYEKWGDNVHDNIKKALAENPGKVFEFAQVVEKRDPKEIKVDPETGLALPKNRPYANYYIDCSHKTLVDEQGYYEMPVLVGRWSLMPGERYGRGPSHLALPDTRTLNKLKERGLEAIDLAVRPPLLANQRDIFGTLNMAPNSVSVVRDVRGIVPFQSGSRIDVMQFSEENLQSSIRSIFFLDKLLLPPRTETGEMTAYEVAQRQEQMQRVLGPVLSRLNYEFLNPLVLRSFYLLLRAGAFPEPPQIILEEGFDLEIVFINQLARAQQIQDVNTSNQWVQGLAFLAQLDPSVIDNINVDGLARHTAKILGVPEEAIQSEKTRDQARQARAQQQQQQQAMESAVSAADVASKLR